MNKKNVKKDILEFGLQVNKTTDLNFVLQKIIEEKSLNLLSTKRAVLYLLDDKREFLIPKTSILKNYIKQTMKEPIPIESSLSGKVAKAKTGMIFNSTSELPDAYQIPGTSDAKDENLMVLPLIINNEVFGTINFYRDNIPYTEQELDLAKIYSMYASIAIQNAQTNTQLQNEIIERKESEEKFKRFFNDNLAGAFISTPNGQIVDCNQAFVDLAGYPDKETALSTNAKNLYEKGANRKTKIDRLRKHGSINQYEEELIRFDGKKIYAVSNIWGEYDENGELKTIQGYTQDITDRKEAENLLIKNKIILEQSLVAIIATDLEGRIISWNVGAEKLYGYKESEILGKPVSKLYKKADHPLLRDIIAQLMEGKSIQNIDLTLVDKNNKDVNILLTLNPVKDKDGNIIELVGFNTNITKQKQLENDLRESEEKYRSIVEGSIQGLVIAQDKPTHISYASKPMEEITGFTTDELLNFGQKELVELIHPDDQQRFFESFKKRLSGETFSPNAEYRIVHKNGKTRWVDLYSSLITVNNEPATQTVFIDITDKKKAEEELKRSEEQFRSVLDNIELIGLMLNDNANIIYANDYLLKLTDHTRKDIIGKNWFDIFIEIEETKADVMKVFRKTAKENNLVTKYENPILTKNGEQRLIRWSNTSHKTRDGNIVLTSIGEDITDLKKHELEIIKKNERLELFATIFENLNECITVTDKDHKIFYVNTAFKKLYGYKEEEYLGKTVDFLRTDNDPEYLKQIKQATNNGGWSGVIMNLKKDGTVFPIELSTTRIYDKEKNIIARIGIVRDITEKKKIEEELKNEMEMTEKAINAQLDTFFVFDPKIGKAVRWNKVFSDVSGYSDEEIDKNKVPDTYYGKDDINKAINAIERVFKEGSASVELNLITKKGKQIPFEYKVTTIEESGRTLLVSIGRDVDERKKIEGELEEYRTNLEKLVSERTEELEEKNKMLDSSVNVFVGREQTIIKLKNKIKELEAQLEAAK